jgi:hypothetical protein
MRLLTQFSLRHLLTSFCVRVLMECIIAGVDTVATHFGVSMTVFIT